MEKSAGEITDSNNKNGTYGHCCILLSGGTGTRFGGKTPKQYFPVAGRTVIEHTLYSLKGWKSMDSLAVVADTAWQDYLQPLIRMIIPEERAAFLGFAIPGENRQLSVLNALKLIEPHMNDSSVVMIHDAVRPMVTVELIKRCEAGFTADFDGVMPFLRVKDTLYESLDGVSITANLDRSVVIAGQTPEFYLFGRYLRANEALSWDELLAVHGSTEPAVKAGLRIALIQGEEGNFKITTAEDMERFRRFYEKM